MNRYTPLLFILFSMLLAFLMMANNVNGYEAKGDTLAAPQGPAGITPTATAPPPTAVPTAIPTAVPTALPPADPPISSDTACLRINFEVSGDQAQEGWYEVREIYGRFLTQWYAYDGWQDSGWISALLISFEAVHVQVFYHPQDGSAPIEMAIYNPAPATTYGWVARNMCHALEVGWP